MYELIAEYTIGDYEGTNEIIDTFDTLEEAEKMLAEYKMAYGTGWYLYVREKKVVCG